MPEPISSRREPSQRPNDNGRSGNEPGRRRQRLTGQSKRMVDGATFPRKCSGGITASARWVNSTWSTVASSSLAAITCICWRSHSVIGVETHRPSRRPLTDVCDSPTTATEAPGQHVVDHDRVAARSWRTVQNWRPTRNRIRRSRSNEFQ